MSSFDKIIELLRDPKKNETYTLRIVTDWLKSKNIDYAYSSCGVDPIKIYEHGIRIKMKEYELSIQTHPSVSGWAFAETLKTNDIINEQRHNTPEDLFNYLEDILKKD